MKIPVVLDVDTGVDDALALLLAATHPCLDLRSVTCVAGNTDVDQVVANTRAVLATADAAHVPTARGAERPLLRPSRPAGHIHGADGLAGLGPPGAAGADGPHAVELLRDALADSPDQVTVVALAPLTNLALLLHQYPRVVDRIDRILFMGGSASMGNATPVAEFNIWHDPEAAAMVLRSGLPTTMYGLDVFYRPALDEAEIQRLEGSTAPSARLAAPLLRHAATTTGDDARLPFAGAACLGDAGALCTLLLPDQTTIETHRVRVELHEGWSRGQTIVDRRRYPIGDVDADGTTDVVLDVDGPAYVDLFLDSLLGAERAADMT